MIVTPATLVGVYFTYRSFFPAGLRRIRRTVGGSSPSG